MIIEYTKITPSVSRPLVFVRISFKDKFLLTKALIDSGSDYSIFPLDFAYTLSIPISSSKKSIFSGFSGEKAVLYLNKVTLTIGDASCPVNVGFTDAIGEYSYSVLGQNGFFDNFKVCFDKSGKQVTVEPKKS